MDVATPAAPRRATRTQCGQLLKFLPIPILEDHARWFDAGPIAICVEGRVLQQEDGSVSERSASIHVFDAGRTEEYLRFDCFGSFAHYHYILNGPQHNVAWGFDPTINGPMIPWVMAALRDRLPTLLRRAEAHSLADEIERNGFDTTALDRIEDAIASWEPRAAASMLEESRENYHRWKAIHPQFDTASD